MKNLPKVRSVGGDPTALRKVISNSPAFKLGYIDAVNGKGFNYVYDRMSFNEPLWYEQGRLFAVALLKENVAPVWKAQVQCPRDLPKMIHAYGRGVVPLSKKQSLSREIR